MFCHVFLLWQVAAPVFPGTQRNGPARPAATQSEQTPMSGTTISSPTTVGLRLTAASQNPVTITSAGSITAPGGYAIYAPSTIAVTITNNGSLSAAAAFGLGIEALAGGTITNQAHGGITGAGDGIYGRGGATTVTNMGSIQGTTGFGIALQAGGAVSNAAAGVITGYAVGVGITGPGTVVNQGRITTSGTSGVGIGLSSGGTLTNAVSGTITGSAFGVYISGGISGGGTVTNNGSIGGAGNEGVRFRNAGTLTNNATGVITGHYAGVGVYQSLGSVLNRGLIRGDGDGVLLQAGGSVSVTSTGTIQGSDSGVAIGGGAGTVVSDGLLAGTHNNGVGLFAGGAVTNQTHGTIAGYRGVYIRGGAGTVTNQHVITGTHTAVALLAGGSVSNAAGGTIQAGSFGVSISGGAGTVTNAGSISGVYLAQGGSVANGSTAVTTATIAGNSRGVTAGAGTVVVTNFGTIAATGIGSIGVNFGSNGSATSSGTVTNGSAANTTAAISGIDIGIYAKAAVKVTNFATIQGANVTGIFMDNGGSLVNGSATDPQALVAAGSGVAGSGVFVGLGSATIGNFGTIRGGTGIQFGGTGVADSTGTVSNGSAADTTALIAGSLAGIAATGAVTVSNSGTILATDTVAGTGIGVGAGITSIANAGKIQGGNIGISFGGNGTVVNGSTANVTALITGRSDGILAPSITKVTNFATIQAGSGTGVFMAQGGSLSNGTAADPQAAVIGGGTVGTGVFVNLGTAAISNFGTIKGGNIGINFNDNGTVVNGSTADTTALIAGSFAGIAANAAVTVSNFATIKATTDFGILLQQGGSITNGSAADTTAAILALNVASGRGVYVSAGAATISNFGLIRGGVAGIAANDALMLTNAGTISGATPISLGGGASATVVNSGRIASDAGAAGTAIQFGNAAERLVLRPGSSIAGQVLGGTGTNVLELASGGAATAGGIGSQFVNFGTVVVDPGADWSLKGVNTAATLTNRGTLAVAAGGTLQVTGAVSAASNGIFQLNNASVLEVLADQGTANQMQFLAPSELIIDQAAAFGVNVGKASYHGPLIENFGPTATIDLKDVALAGAVLNYSTASGLLQITEGGAGVATLAFQTSSLGSGVFHPGDDGSGHLLLTHG
jgi:hypothetical protein